MVVHCILRRVPRLRAPPGHGGAGRFYFCH